MHPRNKTTARGRHSHVRYQCLSTQATPASNYIRGTLIRLWLFTASRSDRKGTNRPVHSVPDYLFKHHAFLPSSHPPGHPPSPFLPTPLPPLEAASVLSRQHSHIPRSYLIPSTPPREIHYSIIPAFKQTGLLLPKPMAPLPDMVIPRVQKLPRLSQPPSFRVSANPHSSTLCNAIYHTLSSMEAHSHLNMITLHTVSQTSIINPSLSAS